MQTAPGITFGSPDFCDVWPQITVFFDRCRIASPKKIPEERVVRLVVHVEAAKHAGVNEDERVALVVIHQFVLEEVPVLRRHILEAYRVRPADAP